MVESLTLGQARSLHTGQILYAKDERNSDGSAQRFRVRSVKTWKRDTSRVEISLKRGLKQFLRIDEDQLQYFSIVEPEPLPKVSRRL
jgi:hypothetical protein